ncbi:hypothetical protein [Clostridium botulinum]|uniref:hypothetical protein n=1 Tax=Clostridium botulinum TaxID=1491 RepID=UPI000774B51D|nr:hypothetical protein [Clostridium botulinum]APH20831.1 hypothetical protein NPD1_4102 [Clostridium botulinum]APQ71159.1 hypothetical protein RSJ8_4059 [Clostridium botulinum]MBN3379084.1 hypothetical protein [Clostridium botulinum]
MEKIKFIYVDVEEETKEIKQLLDKGLIKYFYGKDSNEPDFIYLTKNEDIIKNSITSDYRISDIINQLITMLDGSNIRIKNLLEDKINISPRDILQLIENDFNCYLSEDIQKYIFDGKMFDEETPSDKIINMIKKARKKQFLMQIEDFLIE